MVVAGKKRKIIKEEPEVDETSLKGKVTVKHVLPSFVFYFYITCLAIYRDYRNVY